MCSFRYTGEAESLICGDRCVACLFRRLWAIQVPKEDLAPQAAGNELLGVAGCGQAGDVVAVAVQGRLWPLGACTTPITFTYKVSANNAVPINW